MPDTWKRCRHFSSILLSSGFSSRWHCVTLNTISNSLLLYKPTLLRSQAPSAVKLLLTEAQCATDFGLKATTAMWIHAHTSLENTRTELQQTDLEKSSIYFKVQPKVVSVRNAQGILFLPQVLAVCISVQLKNAFRFTNVQTAQKVYYSLNRMLLHSAILLLRFCVGSVVFFVDFFFLFYILRTCVNKDGLILKKYSAF